MRNKTVYSVPDDRPAVSYGPTADTTSDEWVLAVATESQRVEIVLDEQSMYALWTEVRGVPWPNASHETAEKDRLVRQLVHAANGADESMLRDALATLGVADE